MNEPEPAPAAATFHLKGSLIMSRSGRATTAPTKQDPAKDKRVRKELKHLAEIFSDIDENKRDFVQRQIEQLAWYYVSIADLQAKVDQYGTLVKYDNGGGQNGVRTNPDIKTLMDYQKACNTIVRTLISLVPDGVSSKHRELDSFRLSFQ